MTSFNVEALKQLAVTVGGVADGVDTRGVRPLSGVDLPSWGPEPAHALDGFGQAWSAQVAQLASSLGTIQQLVDQLATGLSELDDDVAAGF